MNQRRQGLGAIVSGDHVAVQIEPRRGDRPALTQPDVGFAQRRAVDLEDSVTCADFLTGQADDPLDDQSPSCLDHHEVATPRGVTNVGQLVDASQLAVAQCRFHARTHEDQRRPDPLSKQPHRQDTQKQLPEQGL